METQLITIGLDQAAPIPLHTAYTSALFEGLEVDLLQRLAADLQLRLSYTVAPWNDLLRQLETGAIGAVCSAVTITPDRQQYMDFSIPYLSFHLCVVCRDDHRLSMPQLSSHPVGVRANTTARQHLEQQMGLKPAHTSHSNEELYEMLLNGQLHAVIDDAPIAHGYLRQHPELLITALLPGTEAQYAIAFKKGQSHLLEKINNALRQLQHTGYLEALKEKWFGNENL